MATIFGQTAVERAVECAEKVVARGSMCYGCFMDSKCKVSSRFALKKARERYPDEKDRLERKRLKARILRLEERLLED